MKAKELRAILAEAELHYMYYRWDDAINCFEQVLSIAPNHWGALDGLSKTRNQKAVEQQMIAEIAAAKAALDAGRYDQAAISLDRAQTLGADSFILNHHAEIETLRDAVLERMRWRIRISGVLADVAYLEQEQAFDYALERLSDLLRELTSNGLEDLGNDARAERDRLQARALLLDRLKLARQAYEMEDFRYALELLESLDAEHPDHRMIQHTRDQFKLTWNGFASQLEGAQTALAEGRLDDAAAILANLRHTAPMNPDWQALWLRAFIDKGRAEFEKSRRAAQRHEFRVAREGFIEASEAFQRVLEVFSSHPSAGQSRAEAQALAEVMFHILQAQQLEKELRWDAARTALRTARQKRLEASQVRNESFGEVEAVLQAMSGEIDERGKRWEEARAALQEGQSSLQSKDLARAIKRLRQGVQSLGDIPDEPLRSGLLQGLDEAERRQQDVQLLLEQAQASEDSQTALDLLRKVYERWPGAPGMPDVLAGKLVEVARQAMDTGQQALAAGCCAEVASLEGVSNDLAERADAIARAIGCREAVAGAVAEADRLADVERRKPRATAAGHQQIVDTLLRARSTAQDCPDLMAGIDERLKPAQERLKRLNKAEPLLEKAEAQRQAGEWTQAARWQEQAVKALGDLAATGDVERLEAWQGAAVAVGQALEQADKGLKQAAEQFRAAREGDLAAVDWTGLRSSLAEVQRILAEPPAGVEPLPAKWQELAERAQTLRERSDVALRAYESVLAGDPDLAELRALAAQSPSDVALSGVLRGLRAQSKSVLQEQASRSLAAARDHAERGEWSEATAQLADARAAGADLPEVAAELAQLDRRIKLWQEIERLSLDGFNKSRSNSLREALDAFREVLRRALDPDSGLPTQVREQVAELLTLENRLDVEESLQRAQALYDHLTTAEASQNRLVQTYLALPVTQWLQLASRGAMVRAIDSALALSQYEDAYESAKRAINKDPDDSYAVDQAAKAREEILNRLKDSVTKRIERAQALRDKGAFAEALADLDRIDSEFIGPIAARFPEIIIGDMDLESLMERAGDLRLEIKKLAERASVLEGLARAIRKSVAIGQLDAAEQAIEEARRKDPSRSVRQAWEELNSLERAVARRRGEALRQKVKETLSAARGTLTGSPKEEAVRQTLISMENIRDQVEQLGDDALGSEYRVLWAEVGTWLEGYEALAQELETAREKERLGALEEQFAALERAAVLAKGKELATIQAKLAELRPRIEQQRQIQEVWDAALDSYAAREFDQALVHLATAARLGVAEADIKSYQQAARAAILLEEAKGLLQANPEEATLRLNQAQSLVQSAALADDLGLSEEIQIYLEAAELRKPEQKAIAALLRDTRSAYHTGDLLLARQRLDAVFDLQPEQPEATQLVRVLEAEELRRRGEYRAALAQVTTALEVYPTLVEARILEAQLKAETEAGEALARARSLAEAKRFAEAQNELARARDLNADHPHLAEVQGYVQEQEDRFRDRALGPATAALRAQDFRTALREYQILLTQAGAPDFKAEIEQLQQWALDQWADYEVQGAADELNKSEVSLDRLLKRRNRLQDVLKTAPGPSERRASELHALVQRIEVRRLRQRLDEGRQATAQYNLELAQAICAELRSEAAAINNPELTVDIDRFCHDLTGVVLLQEAAALQNQLVEFFGIVGFEITRSTDDDFILIPRDASLAYRIGDEVFLSVQSEDVLDGPALQRLVEKAQTYFANVLVDRTLFVVVAHQPDPGALALMLFYRFEHRLTIVPFTAYELREAREQNNCIELMNEVIEMHLGQSDLYMANSPVSDVLNFFGRERVIDRMRRALERGQHVGLFGLRKIGKTSLLTYLRAQSKYPVAWISANEGDKPLDIYHLAVDEWSRSLRMIQPELLDRQVTDLLLLNPESVSDPEAAFRADVDTILSFLQTKRLPMRLVLCIDEIDRLVPTETSADETISEFCQFVGFLQAVATRLGYLGLVVSGASAHMNRVNAWRQQRNPAFQGFVEEFLGPLSREECDKMVASIGARMGIEFHPNALESVHLESGGHPFIARQICSLAVQQIADRPAKMSKELVLAATDSYVRQADYYLSEEMWKPLHDHPAHRSILRALANHESLAESELLSSGGSMDDQINSQRAISLLTERRLIQRDGSRLAIPYGCFRRWILTRHPGVLEYAT